jgi:hypothetical protein
MTNKEIGFKPKTPDYGDCVLQLRKRELNKNTQPSTKMSGNPSSGPTAAAAKQGRSAGATYIVGIASCSTNIQFDAWCSRDCGGFTHCHRKSNGLIDVSGDSRGC